MLVRYTTCLRKTGDRWAVIQSTHPPPLIPPRASRRQPRHPARPEPATIATVDAEEVERHPGSPCRTGTGAVAATYHTGRFTKVPRLAKELRVPAPADPPSRRSGR